MSALVVVPLTAESAERATGCVGIDMVEASPKSSLTAR
jgi:hypothetical protein